MKGSFTRQAVLATTISSWTPAAAPLAGDSASTLDPLQPRFHSQEARVTTENGNSSLPPPGLRNGRCLPEPLGAQFRFLAVVRVVIMSKPHRPLRTQPLLPALMQASPARQPLFSDSSMRNACQPRGPCIGCSPSLHCSSFTWPCGCLQLLIRFFQTFVSSSLLL